MQEISQAPMSKYASPDYMEQAQPVSYQPGTQQNVVTQQPTGMITTVVQVQQKQPLRDWKSGLCDCCEDCKSCMCVFFCSTNYYGIMANRMGENFCVGCSGHSVGCVPGGHIAMRSRFRGTHNIQGSICMDCLVTTFCLSCAMCQLDREMNSEGYFRGCC